MKINFTENDERNVVFIRSSVDSGLYREMVCPRPQSFRLKSLSPDSNMGGDVVQWSSEALLSGTAAPPAP